MDNRDRDDYRFSEDEAAAYLLIKPSTLANWRSMGKGPTYYKPVQKVIYYKADLDTWIKRDENRIGASDE